MKIYHCIRIFIHWEMVEGMVEISAQRLHGTNSALRIYRIYWQPAQSQWWYFNVPVIAPSCACLWFLYFSVVSYNELSVFNDWSGKEVEVEVEAERRDCCLTPSQLLEKKKNPIYVLLLTSVSQCETLWGLPPLSISPSFRLSIPPLIADCLVAMHICW